MRRALPTLSSGEVLCPRKGTPFPAIIAAAACKALHDESPNGCDAHNCKHFETAERRAVEYARDAEEAEAIRRKKLKL